jgi:hypothetical protein
MIGRTQMNTQQRRALERQKAAMLAKASANLNPTMDRATRDREMKELVDSYQRVMTRKVLKTMMWMALFVLVLIVVYAVAVYSTT